MLTRTLRSVSVFSSRSKVSQRRCTTNAPADGAPEASSDASAVKKKKSNKTAEGGADKDIRPLNKQLRDLIADRKFQDAKELFAKMKAEGPKPNVPTYNIMSNLFKAEEDFAALQQLNDEMAKTFSRTKKSLVEKALSDQAAEDEDAKPTRAKPQRKYRPAYRTGPNALLRALLVAPNAKEGLAKDDLIIAAQPLCEVSFTVPSDYNGFYTAWNSMSSLIQKGLVEKSGGIRSSESEIGLTYHLTEAGEALAKELQAEAVDIEAGKVTAPPQPQRSAAAVAQGAGGNSPASQEALKVAQQAAEADS